MGTAVFAGGQSDFGGLKKAIEANAAQMAKAYDAWDSNPNTPPATVETYKQFIIRSYNRAFLEVVGFYPEKEWLHLDLNGKIKEREQQAARGVNAHMYLPRSGVHCTTENPSEIGNNAYTGKGLKCSVSSPAR